MVKVLLTGKHLQVLSCHCACSLMLGLGGSGFIAAHCIDVLLARG
jgi:hypothetical protein